MRRELVVRQRFPIGQQRDAQRRREPRDFVGQPLRGERVGGDDREHALVRARSACAELRERERVGGAGQRIGARPAAGGGRRRRELGQRGERFGDRCVSGDGRARRQWRARRTDADAAGAAVPAEELSDDTSNGKAARIIRGASTGSRSTPDCRADARQAPCDNRRVSPHATDAVDRDGREPVPAADAHAAVLGRQLDRRAAGCTATSRRWR